jgi:hypothetical protein
VDKALAPSRSRLLENRPLYPAQFHLIFFADFSAQPEWPPPALRLVVAIPRPLFRDSSHRRVPQFEIWNPVVCQCRGCAVIATVRKLLRRVTLKNGVNTNVRTASRAMGDVMVALALVQRSSAEVFLASEIHAFIGNDLKSISPLWTRIRTWPDDFGLDLVEITELLTALEERFGVDAETADEPNQIEFMGDLSHYIESAVRMGETQTQPG